MCYLARPEDDGGTLEPQPATSTKSAERACFGHWAQGSIITTFYHKNSACTIG